MVNPSKAELIAGFRSMGYKMY